MARRFFGTRRRVGVVGAWIVGFSSGGLFTRRSSPPSSWPRPASLKGAHPLLSTRPGPLPLAQAPLPPASDKAALLSLLRSLPPDDVVRAKGLARLLPGQAFTAADAARGAGPGAETGPPSASAGGPHESSGGGVWMWNLVGGRVTAEVPKAERGRGAMGGWAGLWGLDPRRGPRWAALSPAAGPRARAAGAGVVRNRLAPS